MKEDTQTNRLPTCVGVVVERHEGLEEAHVLRQVGEDPESELPAGQHKEESEDDVLEDSQADDQDKEPGCRHRQVVDALAHHGGPQREEAHCNDAWTRAEGKKGEKIQIGTLFFL